MTDDVKPEAEVEVELESATQDGAALEAPPEPEEKKRAPLVLGIRLLRVVWRLLAPLAVAVNLVLWAHLLGASESLKEQALVTAGYIFGFALLVALAREILSPQNAELRLLLIPDYRAERLFKIIRAVLFIVLGTHLAIYLVRANGWSESVAALLEVTEKVGLIFFGYFALKRSGLLERLTPAKADSYAGLVARLLIRVVLPIGLLAILFYVIATALGYGALSRWVLMNAGWSCGFILVLGVLYRFLRTRLHHTIAFMRDEHVAESTDGPSTAPYYIGVERILAGTLKILVAVALYIGVLTIWGVEQSDITALLARPSIFGGQPWGKFLGSMSNAAFVWLAYALLRNLLIFILFPKADVEPGARYAMLTVLKYVAVALVAMIILNAFGVDSSTLAVFAGGASVGLGFAMKDVFSNFFGGLIMLLERPVRVGDTIEVAGAKGKVEAIRLRGTTLRTFDGTTVIIPNTSMISSTLANLTYSFETARMQIDVGVAYDEDPAQVERILLSVAQADPRVLDDPAPAVRFTNFGASSLDFSLRVWTHDIDERWTMVSEMRYIIFERFRKAGIEIPFNQLDLHVRSDDTKSLPEQSVS